MALFIFTCPHCKQQFMANDEIIGTTATCSNCGATLTVQKQMTPLVAGTNNDVPMLVLGILGLLLWLLPLFALPIPIIGFILSYNRNYRLGIILNSIGLGLSALWTLICIATE